MQQKKANAELAINKSFAIIIAFITLYFLRLGISAQHPITRILIGVLIILPLIFYFAAEVSPIKQAVYEAFLLISASMFSFLVTEYIVKGGIVIGAKETWMGIFFHMVVFVFFYFLSARIRFSIFTSMIILFIYTLVDHYVLLFRGTPLIISDFFAVGTAKNVANNYSVPIERSVLLGAFAIICFCACVYGLTRKFKPTPRKKQLINTFILCACLWFGMSKASVGFSYWLGNLQYSEVFYFCKTAQNISVAKPDTYSADLVSEIQAKYPAKKGEKKPNIIAIMNESYTDLRVISDFETNEEFMPFVKSMSENTVKGELLVSTIGGGTANTEFEFLSGDTKGFLPESSSPYQLFVKENFPGLVSGLKEQGYETISIHPYHASSWNRETIYDYFGFETSLFDTDFDLDAKYVRDYISDEACVDKIIELYEQKEKDAPMFLFNVTMQNHGSYSDDYPKERYEKQIWLTGENEGKYPATDVFLSLMKYSDDAIEKLVTYFSAVDEPTAIILFGDHHPFVESQIVDELMEIEGDPTSPEILQRRYRTPFFIWANYDIEEKTDVSISANYLSAYALDALKCDMSGFDVFRMETCQEVPQINVFGYFLPDGTWKEASLADENEALSDYHVIEYAHLFDAKNRNSEWYNP